MAAYAALASLLNNIEQMMTHPHLSTSFDNNQIQSLHQKAGFLLGLIEGYDYGGVISKETEDLERQIASAALAAEDVIESHIAHQILAGSNEVSFTCLLHLKQIIQDMDALLKKSAEVKEKHAIKATHSTPLMKTGETAMVGFDDELFQLMDELTNQSSSRRIISIVGMGGTGKTTLAQNVYQNLLIKQHFDIRAWATITQQYNVKGILEQLVCGQGKSHDATVDELGERLHKLTSGRRYLIVLDDIWDVEAWDEVRRFFPDNGNRSRVVVTTRLSNVARDCLSSSSFRMKPLDEDKTWNLFCRKAFQQEKCPHPELERIGKEIARLCRGLPLSTVVIGGLLLNSPRSPQFWESVFRNIKSSPSSKEKEESLDILSLSYNHLPPHLKPCFIFMGVFEEDSEIRVSEVIKLWVAEGFVRPKNTQILEEVAEGYLNELIDRNLVTVRKHRHNGRIGSCGIHDLVRDLCLKVSEQQQLFHVGKDEIRSEESIPLHNEPSPAESVWNEDLAVNVNLRYIAYQPNLHNLSVWSLPSTVSLMWNLQTLIIADSSTIVVAPTEIWKMRQLRHVKMKLCKIYVPDPPPLSDGLLMMESLQTLTRAVNLRVSEEVCKRIPNIKKLYIAYGDEWEGYDDRLMECVRNLDRLHKLESLNLSIRGSKWVETNRIVVRFPISLNKLSLCGCQLGWEDLWVVGLLPQLEVLQLKSYSVTKGRKWSPIEGQFLRLKFLEIHWCPLYEWEADKSHFPLLEKLILSQMWNLEEIPLGMGEIATLELIRVDHCSESVGVSALRIKEDEMENQGTDALQIQLRISDYKLECLKERVKQEGLAINDMKLFMY